MLADANRETRERHAQALHRLSLVNRELKRQEEFVQHALSAQNLANELLAESWSRPLALDTTSSHLILGVHHEEAGDMPNAHLQFQKSLDHLKELSRREPLDLRAREIRSILATKGFELVLPGEHGPTR